MDMDKVSRELDGTGVKKLDRELLESEFANPTSEMTDVISITN